MASQEIQLAVAKDERLTKEQQEMEKKTGIGGTFDSLLKQIQAEIKLCKLSQMQRINVSIPRLKSYAAQKQNPDLVADNTLFTTHQTLLAKFYEDTLSISFTGHEEGDEDIADNVDKLYAYDYEIMQKPQLDYDNYWDVGFFGFSITEVVEFLREGNGKSKIMAPAPRNIDPMTFLYDYKATTVNGIGLGRQGRMRFGGYETEIPRFELQEKNGYFDFKSLRSSAEVSNLVKQAQQARGAAMGNNSNPVFDNDSTYLGENGLVDGIVWYTYWRGNLVRTVVTSDVSRLIKYQVLKTNNRWPLCYRPLFRNAHSFEPISVPDLVEDKQRHRSSMLNLMMFNAKNDLYPAQLYDEDMITNKEDLKNISFNKKIPVKNPEGRPLQSAMVPVNKGQPNYQIVNFVMEALKDQAQRSTATPDVQQGIGGSGDPLGETNLVAQTSGDRYSLMAKVFGWSEKEFGYFWYGLYKDHVTDLDEKLVRIEGSFGTKWRPLTRENMIFNSDPDISIDSEKVTEAKSLKKRLLMKDYGSVLMNDPNANIRYYEKRMGKLSGLDKGELERLLPPTVEELNAEKENEQLSLNKLMQVNPNDDDVVHMEIHNKASETNAKKAHLEAHRLNMTVKRDQPELFQSAADKGTPEQAQMGGGKITNAPSVNDKTLQPQQITPSKAANPAAPVNA